MNKPLDHEELTAERLSPTKAFALALSELKGAARRRVLDRYYAVRKETTWAKAKGNDPSPKGFGKWLNKTFPGRDEIGMVLSDLKHLDEDAYDTMMRWSEKRSKVPREVIESFRLPSGRVSYDAERDASAPRTMAEVRERAATGEASIKDLTRAYSRASHYKTSECG